jgi:hypothetical protein
MRTPLAALLATLLTAASAHAVPFSDGDFVPANWEIVVFSFKSTGGAHPGGSVTATQEAGGYPGTLRQVVNGIVAAPSATEFSTTWGVHFHAGDVWNAAVQGPIGTLDYREDARLFAPGGDGQLTGIAVRQGGVVYVADVDVTPETVWTRKERKGIQAANLYAIIDTGADFNAHPDFSGAGTPLEFGFFRANSNGNGGGSYTITGAIDNWSVRVNPPCTSVLDCDDGDACTTDACTNGACAVTEQDCGDGDTRTIDTCAAAHAHARLTTTSRLHRGRLRGRALRHGTARLRRRQHVHRGHLRRRRLPEHGRGAVRSGRGAHRRAGRAAEERGVRAGGAGQGAREEAPEEGRQGARARGEGRRRDARGGRHQAPRQGRRAPRQG